MNNENLIALYERARTIDILADDLKALIDAAAQLGIIELAETTKILNKRGVKMWAMRKYGESRRKYHALRQREQQESANEQLRQSLPRHADYDCLR